MKNPAAQPARADPAEARRFDRRLAGFRLLAILTALLGLNYIVWRYAASLNVHALWFAIPLVLAETYTLVDTGLFIFMMWKPPRRSVPPPPDSASVDIYITTYNEPASLVRLTVEAAMRIRWKDKNVYLLDDGSRPALAALARETGCGYVTRGQEWAGKPRHAKAGNINNALLQTTGEFLLILDADQIPAPAILERTLGYFTDPKVAFVQTPQYFYNLPPGDPFGSDAPLFYGPIQQGKDGWNAAFFCGSNAVLRREALMQLGVTSYVHEAEERMQRTMKQVQRELGRFQADSLTQRVVMKRLNLVLHNAYRGLAAGQSLEAVSDMVRSAVAEAEQMIAVHDLEQIGAELEALAAGGDTAAAEARGFIRQNMERLARETAPAAPEAVGVSEQTLQGLDLTLADEAIPVHALATISITEDMATAMRLHAMGWRSVFHPEILAYGLAPEDLGSALKQRLRWAEGTIQVFLRENPFLIPGLTFPQRLQYFTTMYSYFSGFFSLIFILAPVVYLFTGIAPVTAWSAPFLWRLIPFLILNKLLFLYVARGLSVWRGEQYSLALFPLWIQAVAAVLAGKKPTFVVTPKQRQGGNHLGLVWPQLLVIGLTLAAIAFGLFAMAAGWNRQPAGVLINVFWGIYNIFMLLSIVRAAVYRPPAGWKARPPDFLFPAGDLSAGGSVSSTKGG